MLKRKNTYLTGQCNVIVEARKSRHLLKFVDVDLLVTTLQNDANSDSHKMTHLLFYGTRIFTNLLCDCQVYLYLHNMCNIMKSVVHSLTCPLSYAGSIIY